MKYVLFVSHGTFALGLHDALSMIVGERNDILSVSLENGMSQETYTKNVLRCISGITRTDEILLLGDLVGGSPLTTAANILAEHGLLSQTVIAGGVNLPLALNAVLMKDTMDTADLMAAILPEARDELKEFQIVEEEAEEEI